MYTVYGLIPTRTFRVLWALEEMGLTYDFIQVPPRSEQVMARNPTGKIPVLEVDETSLTDSTAIMTYLADRHGKLTFPAGTLGRARQDSLTQRLLDELDAVVWTAARHSFVLPEEQRVPDVKDSLKWEFARNLTLISNEFEGPFLMGDMMTIPDIILTHCLNWAFSAKFEAPDDKLKAYAKSMRGRDAFKKVVDQAK